MSEEREERWVVLDFLDRQIIDSTQQPIGKVDDVEFTTDGAAPPKLTSLLSGAEALGQRLGGLLGRAVAGSARRLLTEQRTGPRRIAWSDVEELTYVVALRDTVTNLQLEPALETWFRQHVIEPLPGSGHAGG